ncbi:efflux RND transporter periplasmic adaptor subunit [Alphaproteobacteria bacterium]|nr:efflux RND transporter periplasmic adaptor subunit [Alphaproteobacteria bacterium]
MVRFLKFLITRIIPAFMVLGLFVAGFIYLQRTKPIVEPVALAEKIWKVEVSKVFIANAQPEFSSYSTVKAMRHANLQMAAFGELEYIAPNFKDGAILKKGDVLARLDTTRQRLALASTDAKIKAEEVNITSLQKQSDLRSRLVSRVRKMKAQNAATDASLDEAELALVISENQFEQAKARLQDLEIQRRNQIKDIEDAELVAPFMGSLSEVNIALGQQVTNATSFAVLTEINAAEVPFVVPAELFVNVSSLLNTQVQVIWKSGEDDVASVPATIKRYQSQIDKTDGGGVLYAELNNQGDVSIPMGAFVEVIYKGLNLANVALIPETALHADNQVYTVVDGRSVAKNIDIKYRSNGLIWAKGELQENDLVIATRLPGLAAGMKVEISEIIDLD